MGAWLDSVLLRRIDLYFISEIRSMLYKCKTLEQRAAVYVQLSVTYFPHRGESDDPSLKQQGT